MGLSVEPRTCACGWQGECDDGEAEDDQKSTLRELWEAARVAFGQTRWTPTR